MKFFLAALVFCGLSATQALAEPINPINGSDPGSDAGTVVGQLDFGSVPYDSSQTMAVHLTNSTTQNVTLLSWKLNAFSFSVKNNCPKILAPKKSCRFNVTFTNSFGELASGTLDIKTSDKNYRIDLYAEGEQDPVNNIPVPPPIEPPFPHLPPHF